LPSEIEGNEAATRISADPDVSGLEVIASIWAGMGASPDSSSGQGTSTGDGAGRPAL
jgi:hypothetical protein